MKPLPLFVALAGVAILALTAGAQSPNPFGIPSADQPTPGSAIDTVPGSRAQGWLFQGRSEVLARNGIVATSDPLAAQAGLEILQRGGNAIDAAVATGAVLDVTSQNDTGIGGDLFALVWSARDKKLYALNPAGWAPAAWTPQFFTGKLGVKSVPGSGVEFGDGARRDLRLRRAAQAVRHADLQGDVRARGEDCRRRLGTGRAPPRRFARRDATALRADTDSRQIFLEGDRAPDLYSIIRNPALAKALRLLQKDGRNAFYRGDIAAAIVRKVQAGGGVMTRNDLEEFQSEWVEPISTSYHGYNVFELPPPGQGFAALEMLNILEVCVPKLGMSLTKLGPADPMYWHLMVEAKKLAYSDLHAYNGDPKFASVPLNDLLSKSYAATLCDKINPNAASKPRVGGGLDGGTIYLTTADRWGNMVSLIHSVFSVYGSRASVGEFGFVLHNRGSAFSLEPRSPNVVAPRKRPFHTIIAGFVMKDGQPLMTFGNMGGSVQPETHAQHMVNLIDLGMNVQMTTDAARFTHSQNSNVLSLEANLFNRLGAALKAKGHEVRAGHRRIGRRLPGDSLHPRSAIAGTELRSRADAPVNGVYRAGSDHRKDGQAVGW